MGPEDESYDISHRSDDQPNPSQWDQYRQNPNDFVIEMEERIEDPTDLEWMD